MRVSADSSAFANASTRRCHRRVSAMPTAWRKRRKTEEAMIMFSTRARITGPIPDAIAWAIEVANRVGGFNDVIWVARLDDLAAVDKLMGTVQASADYLAALRTANEKKL